MLRPRRAVKSMDPLLQSLAATAAACTQKSSVLRLKTLRLWPMTASPHISQGGLPCCKYNLISCGGPAPPPALSLAELLCSPGFHKRGNHGQPFCLQSRTLVIWLVRVLSMVNGAEAWRWGVPRLSTCWQACAPKTTAEAPRCTAAMFQTWEAAAQVHELLAWKPRSTPSPPAPKPPSQNPKLRMREAGHCAQTGGHTAPEEAQVG